MKKTILALIFSGSIAVTGAVQADIMTDSFTNSLETTEISQTGSLSMFDSALGTLDSLILTLSGDSISNTVMTNTASGAQSFSFESTLNFFFDVTSVNQVVPVPTFETTLASTGGFVTLASNETLDLGTQNDSGFYELMVSGAALVDFIGAAGDTFELGCNTFTGSNMTGGGGNIETAQQTQASCSADIAYTYSADIPVAEVPEPSTLWLFGASILGFAGLRKRKAS